MPDSPEPETFRQLQSGGGAAPTALTARYGAVQGKFMIPASGVSVEVYYFTLCPHCEYFLKYALGPLVEARLSSEQLSVRLVPVYPPLLQSVDSLDSCLARNDCHFALAPLCALKATGFRHQTGTSEPLLAGTRFALCDIAQTAEGHGRVPDATRACAQEAGIDADELQACAEGAEAMELLKAARDPLLSAMAQLHDKAGWMEPPGMPWVFVNGQLLDCMGDGARCTGVLQPTGEVTRLPAEATLLELVCSKLNPAPPQCAGGAAVVTDAAEQKLAEEAKACENCAEVTPFNWQDGSANQGGHGETWAFGVGVVAAIALVIFGVCAASRHDTHTDESMPAE